MIKNLDRMLVPSTSRVMKQANQFPAFGIYTDYGQPLRCVVIDLPPNIAKLLVPLQGIRGFSQSRLQSLKVYSKRKVHALQQLAHRVGRNSNTCALQLLGNFECGFSSPFASTDRVSSGFMFHNFCNRLYDLRRFFSTGLRPPPLARNRLVSQWPFSRSRRPRATVCGSMPKRLAM